MSSETSPSSPSVARSDPTRSTSRAASASSRQRRRWSGKKSRFARRRVRSPVCALRAPLGADRPELQRRFDAFAKSGKLDLLGLGSASARAHQQALGQHVVAGAFGSGWRLSDPFRRRCDHLRRRSEPGELVQHLDGWGGQHWAQEARLSWLDQRSRRSATRADGRNEREGGLLRLVLQSKQLLKSLVRDADWS